MKKLMITMMVLLSISIYAKRDESRQFKEREKPSRETQEQYIEKMSRGNQSHKKLDLSVDKVIEQNRERNQRGSRREK